jgi:hypothetical protein
MRTLAGLVAALVLACGSAKPQVPQKRVALVFGPPAILRISGYDRPIMRALRDHVHATRVASRLSDLDENEFDVVIVMLVSGDPGWEQTYDPGVLDQLRAQTYPIAYEIRRGGSTSASGSITLVVPDQRSTQPQPYIRGLPDLARDIGGS